MLGHFIFNNNTIPFYLNKSKFDSRCYLIDETYIDIIKSIDGVVGDLYEDVHSDNSDARYSNSHIKHVYLTTNFPGRIEVKFKTNINIKEIRDIKLNLLIGWVD